MWAIVLALDFFYLSSPLVFEPSFDVSMQRAAIATTIACVLAIPRLRVPHVPWSVLALLAFGLASSLWSINHEFTVHFVGLYVVVTLMAAVVACNVDTRVLSHGLVLGAVTVVATSLYAYWRGLPGAAVPPGSSGLIAGVGTNRNILAYCMILAFAFAVSFVPQGRLRRIGWGLGVVTILGGILLAESATGIAASAVLVAAALLLGARDRRVTLGLAPGRRQRATLAALLGGLGAIAVAWYVALPRDSSRDFSLTGRVQIWESAWAASSNRVRLIGDGWGSVWTHPWRPAPANGAFDHIMAKLGHAVPHGHNSWIDLLPEIGLVGAGLFALIYLQPVVRGVRQRSGSSDPATLETGRTAILGVLGLLLAGTTEPLSVVPVGFFVAVLLAAHVGRQPAKSGDPVTTPE